MSDDLRAWLDAAGLSPAEGAPIHARKVLAFSGLEIPQELPFLSVLCWQVPDVHVLSPEDMLRRYEQGVRYHGTLAKLEGEELAFARALNAHFKGTFNG